MRRQRTELEWAELLQAYKESGKSLSAFGEERGLSKSSLYGRVRKLRKSSSEFIELPRAAASNSFYELTISNVTLRIPSSEQPKRIAELMRALIC